MNITIEAHVLNHHKRSGLMTYTEGLVYGMNQVDHENQYSLLYYSLNRKPANMPGPEGINFRKIVLRVPDRGFTGRQKLIDSVVLPMFFKNNKVSVFHRTCGYTMPRTKKVYRILTIHDLRTLTIGDNLWQQNIKDYIKTIADLDMCVVVSECTKRDLMKYLKVPEKKIKVIYLGTDSRFKPASKEQIQTVHQKYGLREPFLFSIGSVPRKNIDGIIRGFAQSKITKNYQLVLSCRNDLDKYQQLTKDLNIEGRIIFLPHTEDEETVALYGSCHAFVFPSLYEGFGLPILEAMQCGAPVITSNVSSCPEVAGNAAILVDPSKTEEIAEAINQICTNTILRQDLIQKGFQRVKLFSWDNCAQEIRKVYITA